MNAITCDEIVYRGGSIQIGSETRRRVWICTLLRHWFFADRITSCETLPSDYARDGHLRVLYLVRLCEGLCSSCTAELNSLVPFQSLGCRARIKDGYDVSWDVMGLVY